MSEGRKCGRTTFCARLSARLNDVANAHGHGFSTVEVVSKTDMDAPPEVVGVAYKRDRADRGLMLNFCPWCGEKILHVSASKAAAPSETPA